MALWGCFLSGNLGLRFADVSIGMKPKLMLSSVCYKSGFQVICTGGLRKKKDS